MFRHRRTWFVVAPIVAVLVAFGVWFCFPLLRLMAHADHIQNIPKPQARWVDAHRYDSVWFDAARVGRIDILQALYEAHYPIDSQTSSGYSAVVLAAYNDQPDALRYLLSIGANACLGDRNGNTALMGALYKGHAEVARTLLSARCPIDQNNNAGETALSFATLFGRLDLLPAIIAKGADIDHVDAHGNTALAVALKQGNTQSANALRRLGAKD
jgi:ankyrin repeat protein